jgi:hypothetical protein
MAIATLDGLIAALAAAQTFPIYKATQTAEGAGLWHSLWAAVGNPVAGVAPGTTAIACTNATAGAIPFQNAGGGLTDYIGALSFKGTTIGSLVIYDRLVTVSGLAGNVVSVDTAVNSTALTRYTDGVGVELWAEVYSAMGATGSTLSCRYTDQDGNTNQVGTYVQPANALAVGQMVQITLATGDTGVRAVTAYHWSGASGTGSAGNFGFTLLKKLLTIPITIANTAVAMNALDHGLTKIEPSACLAMMVLCSATNTGNIFGSLQKIGG